MNGTPTPVQRYLLAFSALRSDFTLFLQTLSIWGSPTASCVSLTTLEQTGLPQYVRSKGVPWLFLVCPESIDYQRSASL